MADGTEPGVVSYSTDMDGPEHEATYARFTHFTAVGTVFCACIVAALAVGAVRHAWISTMVGVLLATITTAMGLASTRISWKPSAAVLAMLLVMLALY